jgi:hypothetical protein
MAAISDNCRNKTLGHFHDPTLALVMALRGLETCCFGGLAIF